MSSSKNILDNNIITHNGYRFNKKKTGKKNVLYWCVCNRSSKSICTSKVRMDLDNITVLEETGVHEKSCSWKSGVLTDITNLPEGPDTKKRSIDFTEEMYSRTVEIASTNLSLRPTEIWKMISGEMNEKSSTWKGMSDNQVKNLVKNTRAKINGSDLIRKLESEPLSMVQNSSNFFLQFNLTIPDCETRKMHRIIGYGNPALFGTLAGNVQIYIDGTFNIVPHPFYQCLIIMVYDIQTTVYVPVMYILMTGNSESMYWHALHWMIVCSGWRLEPFSVTCDFEKALHNAVTGQFKGTKLNGCLFHWKQAIRRKMIALKIDSDQISMAMTTFVLDVLTVIPPNEIRSKGIPYVKSIIDEELISKDEKDKWEYFWERYFITCWMSSDSFIKTWNIHCDDGSHLDIQNKTKNTLERYNRSLNEKNSTPHPSPVEFVTTIEEKSRVQVKRLNDIRSGNVQPPKLQGSTLFEPPLCYMNFEPS